jgi:hypothetical protein
MAGCVTSRAAAIQAIVRTRAGTGARLTEKSLDGSEREATAALDVGEVQA